MQVKVFESADMASGLKMVKKALGPDALILSTRTIKNGKLGLLGKPMLEITAAIDNTVAPGNNFGNDIPTRPEPPRRNNKYSAFNHIVDDSVDHLLNQQKTVSGTFNNEQPPSAPPPPVEETGQSIHDEVNELKNLVKGLVGEVSRLHNNNGNDGNNEVKAPQSLQVKSDYQQNTNVAGIHGDHILSMLVDRGINVETSRTIAGFLRESLTDQELINSELVTSTIIDTIQSLLDVTPPVFTASDKQRIIAFVGPTGVGKTTTLAKIAAYYLTNHSPSIALITIDTYRIAAVEQLKVYGEIMHLPVDVVISPDQLKSAINKHSDKDLILIDTAGRSPRDAFCIDELATFLTPDLNIDKHLVLSATTRENELLHTIERFNNLSITNTIFTKIDECTNLGILLNIQIQNSNPLSYVTNGQRVPEDLLEISHKTVAELIMSQHEGLLHD